MVTHTVPFKGKRVAVPINKKGMEQQFNGATDYVNLS